MKYVSDSKAAKDISAYVILNKKGEYVAKVQAHFSAGGTTTVNIFDEVHGFQASTGSWYGQDGLASALNGLQINGVRLYDHSGNSEATRKLEKRLSKLSEDDARKKATAMGARLANYDSTKGHYTSVLIEGGLDRLTMLGYKVIQAI